VSIHRGVIIVAASIGVLASPALAQTPSLAVPGEDQRQVSVAFGDLNINAGKGARILLQRIRAGAQAVCGPRPSTLLDLAGNQRFDRCVDQAVGQAVAGLRNPKVASVYTGVRQR
jgi:UrcA family protein